MYNDFDHSGAHINSVPPLPLPHTIPQNQGKTSVLPVLPPVAALLSSHHLRTQNTVDDFA